MTPTANPFCECYFTRWMSGISPIQPLGSIVAGSWNAKELHWVACSLSSSPLLIFAFFILSPNCNLWSFFRILLISPKLSIVGDHASFVILIEVSFGQWQSDAANWAITHCFSFFKNIKLKLCLMSKPQQASLKCSHY